MSVFNQGLNVISICAANGNVVWHHMIIWSSHRYHRPPNPQNICDVEM